MQSTVVNPLRERSRLKTLLMWGLVGLNVLLLALLVNRFMRPNTAMAQGNHAGDTVCVPGTLPGITDGVVFMLDTANGKLGAVIYNGGTRQFNNLPQIDISRVMNQANNGGGAQPPRRGAGR